MNLGKAIKTVRVQRELSQIELATLSEISVSYLSLLERNKRDPAMSTVAKIANGLNVPLVVLIFLSEDDSDLLPLEVREKLSHQVMKLTNAQKVK